MERENERKRIGKRIEELRIAKGLTQEQLSLAAGLQRSHILRIEQGRYNFQLDTLAAIAEVLGKKIDFIEL